jgi:hypothetical protein
LFELVRILLAAQTGSLTPQARSRAKCRQNLVNIIL